MEHRSEQNWLSDHPDAPTGRLLAFIWTRSETAAESGNRDGAQCARLQHQARDGDHRRGRAAGGLGRLSEGCCIVGPYLADTDEEFSSIVEEIFTWAGNGE